MSSAPQQPPELLHLTEVERATLEHAAQIGEAVLEPLARAGAPGKINRTLLAALGREGLLGKVVDPAVSALELCLLREGLARRCTEAETALAVQGLGANPILLAGAPEVMERWREPLASGAAAAGFALTEPDAGSDVAGIALAAERDGGGWRLTGTKLWISNAPDADVFSVFARTTRGAGARGLTAFAVPRRSDGLHGESIALVAPHPIGRLDFDGVWVPDTAVLGEVDGGFGVAMRTLDLFRPSVGAFAVGMAQAALDSALDHAAGRHAFGRTLSEFQGVSHQLSEVATRVHASRLLVHHAARAYDSGTRPVTRPAAMAKLFATESAQAAIDVAIQVHGAAALREGHLLERLYREVRATRIYEGASEIQREIVARSLFRDRKCLTPHLGDE